MKKYFFQLGSIILFLLLVTNVFAQSTGETGTGTGIDLTASGEEIVNEEAQIEAVIKSLESVEVNKNIIFNATQSKYDQDQPIIFRWDLGDGTIMEGEDVSYTYETVGVREVKLTIIQGDKISEATKTIFVYEKIITLITDNIDEQKIITKVSDEAKRKGLLIKSINDFDEDKSLSSINVLTKKVAENLEEIENSDLIIVWPKRAVDFGILTSAYQDTLMKDIDFSQKTVLFITRENFTMVGNYSQDIYEIIKPRQILITSKDVFIPSLLIKELPDDFINELKSFVDYKVIDEQSRGSLFFNFVARLVLYMKTVLPTNTIILILIFPLIATIIAFCRQVIGITTFGVYTPSILTLSFMALGLKFGLMFFLIILFAGTIIRMILGKFRLLYIPKVAIILTGISFVVLVSMALGAFFNVAEITSLAVFPLLIVSTLSEKFVSMQSEKGFTLAIISTLQTLVVTLICYLLVNLEMVQNYVLAYPGFMFFGVIIANIALGRYTGLRLTEYFRFREVFHHMEE